MLAQQFKPIAVEHVGVDIYHSGHGHLRYFGNP
jgi:hypothetical protein